MSVSRKLSGLSLLFGMVLSVFVGCGPTTAKDPLAGVGGYKLVYQAKEKRRIQPVKIATALRDRINARRDGEVVVNVLDDGTCEILLPGASEKTVTDIKRAIALSNLLRFRIVAIRNLDDKLIASAEGGKNIAGATWVGYDPGKVTLPLDAAVRKTAEGKDMVLVIESDAPVDAWHVLRVVVARDEVLRPCIDGDFHPEGAERMEKLTSGNLHRQFAIILDSTVISAPTIISPFSKNFRITGKFTVSEVEFMAETLGRNRNLGSLKPEPSTETHVPARKD